MPLMKDGTEQDWSEPVRRQRHQTAVWHAEIRELCRKRDEMKREERDLVSRIVRHLWQDYDAVDWFLAHCTCWRVGGD